MTQPFMAAGSPLLNGIQTADGNIMKPSLRHINQNLAICSAPTRMATGVSIYKLL